MKYRNSLDNSAYGINVLEINTFTTSREAAMNPAGPVRPWYTPPLCFVVIYCLHVHQPTVDNKSRFWHGLFLMSMLNTNELIINIPCSWKASQNTCQQMKGGKQILEALVRAKSLNLCGSASSSHCDSLCARSRLENQ